MRTTVTLDPDVAARLKAVANERGVSFKVALNAAVRSGLDASSVPARPYRVPTRPLGLRPGVDLDHALRLAADDEDAELVRKLHLRK
ncbi:MAG: CopG family transcriptional regulator [Acidimicrobiales bacterium]